MSKSRAQRVMEEIRSEKPVLNDANYMSQLERQRDRLFDAIAADTESSSGPMWANPHDLNEDPPFTFCYSRQNEDTGYTLRCLILALTEEP